MKQLIVVFVFMLCFSCIPLRIAPSIDSHKIMVAKKFKRKLPKLYAFIFEDPKDANEFYNYVNTKYERNHLNVEWSVPFELENKTFYFSFYEVEIPDKTLNLIPILIDAKRESNGNDPLFEDDHISRKGNWYLALTVTDYDGNDCLKLGYNFRPEILKYLKELKAEYLNTSNYLEALLKKE